MGLLEKNLDCIKHYYDISVFENVDDSEIELVLNPSPNLKLGDCFLHDKENPLVEAIRVFNQSQNNKRTNLVLFGIGLGYLFQLSAQKFKGCVLLFEQDLRILKKAFSLVDFSAELSKSNVYIASDFQSFETIFKRQYKYQSQIVCAPLPSYKNLEWKIPISDFVTKVSNLAGSQMVDFNYLKNTAYLSLVNTIKNIPAIINSSRISDYKNLYKGKTALLVSAGPTLDENIDLILQNRDKFVIFVVGTACRVLMKKGIIPDYLVVLESYNCFAQLKGLDLSEINIILEAHTNPIFYQAKTKKKIIYISNKFMTNNYLMQIIGKESKDVEVLGTVSYMAMLCAQTMGFEKLVLVGQDLAYVDGKCYSENAAYSDLYFEVNPDTKRPEVKAKDLYSYGKSLKTNYEDYTKDELIQMAQKFINQINSTLLFVEAINGPDLVTTVGYSVFIKNFEDFAKTNTNLKLINTSMKGAQINGFENLPLKEVLKQCVNNNVEIKPFNKALYNIDLIKNNIAREISLLKEYIKYVEPVLIKCTKIKNLKQKRRLTTTDGLSLIKTIVNVYDSDTYKDKLLCAEAMNIACNLQVQLDFDTCDFTSEEDMSSLCESLMTYFTTLKNRADELIVLLERTYESINTES